jgi:hypothetical protein
LLELVTERPGAVTAPRYERLVNAGPPAALVREERGDEHGRQQLREAGRRGPVTAHHRSAALAAAQVGGEHVLVLGRGLAVAGRGKKWPEPVTALAGLDLGEAVEETLVALGQ